MACRSFLSLVGLLPFLAQAQASSCGTGDDPSCVSAQVRISWPEGLHVGREGIGRHVRLDWLRALGIESGLEVDFDVRYVMGCSYGVRGETTVQEYTLLTVELVGR